MKRKILFPVLAVTCFIFAAHPALTQEKKVARAAEIETEIDKLEDRLIELRAELFQIKKKKMEPELIAKVRKEKILYPFRGGLTSPKKKDGSGKAGQMGAFPQIDNHIFKIISIINEGEALVNGFTSGNEFILRISTKRLKEGGVIDLKPE